VLSDSEDLQRYVAVGLFFASTLVAPALLTAVTTDTNRWTVLAVTAVISVAATAFGVRSLGAWEARRRRRALISVPGAQPREVLVVTAGPNHFAGKGRPTPLLRLQLEQTKPSLLAIIGSRETKSKETDLISCLDGLSSAIDRPGYDFFLTDDADSVDLTPVQKAVQWAREHSDAGLDDIVVDVTGGTTSMSVSALLAATNAGIDCQIVRQDKSGATRILNVGD
jgi:hypothetical protein